MKLSNPKISFSTKSPDDYEKLAEIYRSTREKEMEQVSHWTQEQKDEFLNQQFYFQDVYYTQNYIGANFWLIKLENETIGRLYLHPNFEEKSLRIIDIALLPNWQNKGFGTGLLLDIQEEARKLNRSITIHVESFNPAMELYKRLGFKKISETNGVYFLFEWTP